MEDRLVDLETRLAFQEQTLEKLNEVIVDQERRLDVLSKRLQAAEERLRAIPVSNVERSEDEPPPHY